MAYLEQHGTDPVCSIDVLGLGASAAGEVAHRSESGQEQAFGSLQPSMVIKVDEIPKTSTGKTIRGELTALVERTLRPQGDTAP